MIEHMEQEESLEEERILDPERQMAKMAHQNRRR
jgi:hypothetical protein